jgi:tRNA U34 5-carboxymethylaminomethyl modifying GTPase MnmE/TrmE
VSHKIAGPIYRLEKAFEDFKKGTIYKVNIRPKDQMKKLVDSLNEFLEGLIDNFTLAKRRVQNVKDLIEKEKKECQKEDINYQQLNVLSEELKFEAKELQAIITSYKTD